MTDLAEPSALDGHARAKPDEPTFTFQGGDKRCFSYIQSYIDERRNDAAHMDEGSERENELVRCTEAEAQLWKMQAYFKGQPEDTPASDAFGLPMAEVINLHDYRIMAASLISNMFSTLFEIRERLPELGYKDHMALRYFDASIKKLRRLFNHVEPRPGRNVSTS